MLEEVAAVGEQEGEVLGSEGGRGPQTRAQHGQEAVREGPIMPHQREQGRGNGQAGLCHEGECALQLARARYIHCRVCGGPERASEEEGLSREGDKVMGGQGGR